MIKKFLIKINIIVFFYLLEQIIQKKKKKTFNHFRLREKITNKIY